MLYGIAENYKEAPPPAKYTLKLSGMSSSDLRSASV